jgi:hypothetical protein
MIGSNLQGVLSYSNDASGFLSRTYTYDANLLYSRHHHFRGHQIIFNNILARAAVISCYTWCMESKRKIIVGNWKMNPVGSSKALAIFKAIKKNISSYKNIDVIVAVPWSIYQF